jgi:hypothetical protein
MPFALARLGILALAFYAGLVRWPGLIVVPLAALALATAGLAYGLHLAHRSAQHLHAITGGTRRVIMPTAWPTLLLRDLIIGLALASLAFLAGYSLS